MGKKPNIALIGPYPPPYGGVSVHLQRLTGQLEHEGFEYSIYDTGKAKDISQKNVKATETTKGWRLKYFLTAKEDIVHYHGYEPKSQSFLKLLLFFSLLSLVRGKKVIFTIHSFRYNIMKIKLFHKFVFRIAAWANVYFIAVGPKIKDKSISLGIAPEKIVFIPAFIPPIIREDEIAAIPGSVWDFIARHNPVISANAFRISFYNNQDLYGIDMCIDLCANLKHYYSEIGFVFCLPDIGDHDYYTKMKQKIVEKGIETNFLFITEQYQYYPILMKCDVFVRPTNTDGDAVSLREALYFRIPTVASDAVSRPEGTIVFKSRDNNDFTSMVKDVIDDYEREVAKLEGVANINCADTIIELYHRLTGDRSK